MKIAVIGGSGFIGSEVIKVLSRHKNVDIIATYKKSRILSKNKKIVYKKLDISKKKTNFFKYLEYPDVVINLSWSGLSNYESISHINNDLNYQKKFIKNLIENGLENIFISGTCYEYGKKKGSLNEGIITNPKTNYAIAKDCLRKYVFFLKKKYKFNLIWGRIFYVYGKINTRRTLYSSIIDAFKKNKVLEVQGRLIRDYLSVQQLSKYIVKLSLIKKDIGVINICSGLGISLKSFVKNICFIKKINPDIKFIKILKNPYESEKFWGNNLKLNLVLKSKRQKFIKC